MFKNLRIGLIFLMVLMSIGVMIAPGVSSAEEIFPKYSYSLVDNIYYNWEQCGTGIASVNNQTLYSFRGQSVEHVVDAVFNASLSFNIPIPVLSWLLPKLEMELGYHFTTSSSELTGTSTILQRDEQVVFYYRPVVGVFDVIQTYYVDETYTEKLTQNIDRIEGTAYQYAWVIFDKNHKIIEDTRDNSILRENELTKANNLKERKSTKYSRLITSNKENFIQLDSLDHPAMRMDANGNMYQDGICLYNGKKGSDQDEKRSPSIIYEFDGTFTNFTGSLSRTMAGSFSDDISTFSVYGNDDLLFTQKMGRHFKGLTFDLCIEGITELQFVYDASDLGIVMLVDPYVYAKQNK